MGVVIDEATILEWPQIEQLARAYFASMGRVYQDRREGPGWIVARDGERVLGCYSMQVDFDFMQAWVLDLYRVEGFAGARALCALYRDAYARAQRLGCDVGFAIDPNNVAWRRCVERYGHAELIGMVYLHRTDREIACLKP